MTCMLTLQRRHSDKCPDRNKGPNYLKCRGHCALRVCGMTEGRRVRLSLRTRDLARAARRVAELEDRASGRPRKSVEDAVAAFHAQHAGNAHETRRKYRRLLGSLASFCETASLHYVDQIGVEAMDRYALARARTGWAWIKEIELLRQFFEFCRDREWTTKNPARSLKRPVLREANNVVPYTPEEIVRILAACAQFGRTSYERRRARAIRISDVVTLGREHVQGSRLQKRAVKNHRMIRVELPPVVLQALDVLPPPKAAARNSTLFFASGTATLRSLVKGGERTMAAVFRLSGVGRAHCHRFRHTLASELLGKGGTIEEIAAILGDGPATIRRYYAKWTPEYQSRQDALIRTIHGTDLAQQAEMASKC